MPMKITTTAYHLRDRLDLKQIKSNLAFNCIYTDPTELLYQTGKISYFQIFDYGSIVFLGNEKTTQTDILASIQNILGVGNGALKSENFDIEVNPDVPSKVLFDKVIIREINPDIAKIIMINIAQSVALDNYIEQSNVLLTETTHYSNELEESGKFSIRGKKLLKFIGRTLNLKNKITQNLYIFDSPQITWNDELLNKLNNDLHRELDINIRYSSLVENLNNAKDNLEVFQDISQHNRSSALEWVVIILIAVEIVNLLFDKLF
jgi:uncharacterized Rmd1/YagE family protein